MAVDKDAILTAKNGALFIQPDGPNTELHYLGCHGLGTISAPKGSITLLQCFNKSGEYETRGRTKAAPAPITSQITSAVDRVQSLLEQMEEDGCGFAYFVNSVACPTGGRLGQFITYDRGMGLPSSNISQVDDNNPQHHREDTEYTQAWSIESNPERFRYFSIATQREVTAATDAYNDIFSCDGISCLDGCDTPHRACQTMYAVADSAVGPAVADVYVSQDGGNTWAATAANPFAAGASIMSGVCFQYGRNTIRLLVAMEAPVGGQGMVAYSDDQGATWTTVNIGGAVAGHGALYGKALFALDAQHIWLASENGYIYFSEDGGVTWVAQQQGVISANGYMQIKFFDENYGVAVNDTGGVVISTTNGGETWTATTVVTGAPAMNTIEIVSQSYLWTGTQTGLMYFSDDFGTTWNARVFPGSGVGQVRDIVAIDEYVLWMVVDTAGPVGTILRTVTGGYAETWEDWTTPANSGLNAILACRVNTAVAVGEPNAATAFVSRSDPSPL